MAFSKDFWNEQYLKGQTGWDIGYASPPLVEYISQLTDKNLTILIPGAGKGWEAEYLYKSGFYNTFLLDYSVKAKEEFKSRCPEFPEKNIILGDFFKHDGIYDLILEQTFFSSLHPAQREDYVLAVKKMLKNKGKLAGLFFNHLFSFEGPPFGGTENEYRNLFSKHLEIKLLDIAYNSIKPRKDREFFIILCNSLRLY